MNAERFLQKKKEVGMEFTRKRPSGIPFASLSEVDGLIYVSGNVPFVNGELVLKGRVGETLTVEEGARSAMFSALNCLEAVNEEIGLDNIERVVRVTGYVACAGDFTEQATVVNGASLTLNEVFRDQPSLPARTALGVYALPLGVSTEVEMILLRKK
ncbi:MAG: hypothetical protein K0R75_649 [Paenibacillaceae bacterium]|jgi:enamine deaminase RidA (YjgF/YER057c/UK114 family)|nr:hypothetical protein [Paenibacillaceae bacterium]